jgi:cell wall-associated NlpC family hydrolase
MTNPFEPAFIAAVLAKADEAKEAAQRAAVVAEAKTWLGTPYHHAAMVKGHGVDCAMLPYAVYAACGLSETFEVAPYPCDWHMHRDAERYMAAVLAYATEVPEPTGPGDFVLYRWGRCFAHGAIITGWPEIIHSMAGIGVLGDDGTQGRLNGREKKFFTMWGQR